MMRSKDSLLFGLLQHAAGASGAAWSYRLQKCGEDGIETMVRCGLGPLLHHALADHRSVLPAKWQRALHAADLTAQVRHASAKAVLREVVQLCASRQVPVTLLKGISVSEQYYPAGHLRPMGDIDVLVPRAAVAALVSALMERDYLPSPAFRENEHVCHAAPLLHPVLPVWLEVHWALFPPTSAAGGNGAFDAPRIAEASAPCVQEGLPVLRLNDEMQLLYTAAAWLRDLCSHDLHLSHAPPLFDALFVLHGRQPTFSWDRLLQGVRNDTVAASLLLMLAYLSRHRLYAVDPDVLRALQARQPILGSVELKLLLHVLDRRLLVPSFRLFESWHLFRNLLAPARPSAKLAALPWKIAFPPTEPRRYRLSYHVERCGRLARRIGGRRVARTLYPGDVLGPDRDLTY